MIEWRDIKGYEGKYQVSNDGQVRSLNYHREKIIKIMTPKKTPTGYLTIGLLKNKVKKFFGIHRLVALCFLEQIPGADQVNHKDANKQNNNVENLEWVTAKENTLHAIKHGLFDSSAELLKACNESRKKRIVAIKEGKEMLFPSIHAASRALGVDRKHIKSILLGNYPTAKGYIFQYAKGVVMC